MTAPCRQYRQSIGEANVRTPAEVALSFSPPLRPAVCPCHRTEPPSDIEPHQSPHLVHPSARHGDDVHLQSTLQYPSIRARRSPLQLLRTLCAWTGISRGTERVIVGRQITAEGTERTHTLWLPMARATTG